ncbi:adenylate/guanylate cyclase domain-containing protein [Mycolicibacterium sp. 050232]|uniref:adenylate/guanylate cyclase domain-containing protein n=1 Tax=Mycolicibacterium sp. 050232 TaxID=3113982 RepID=UPI002E297912|nr:adenylate/guanylate cyclase domain-containing protein [Mycolicibacterium sp. 050232]MED5814771.1 adenylate/guanylate cyclase domain-containing protein [Mycolicibacterium sp. 050232]
MTSPTEPKPRTETETAPKPKGPRRGVLSRISIQSKLLVMLLLTSVFSAAVVGFIGYQSGRHSLRDSVFDRLTQIRESQARHLEATVGNLTNSMAIYTRGATPEGAMRDFAAGFAELGDANITPPQQQSLTDYYTDRFAPSGDGGSEPQVDVDALLPQSNPQRYLQAHYTTAVDDRDAAIKRDDARDGSAWSAANARYNDYFREIVNRFEFVDALLIDTRGNVVYSAYKGVDLGTNILNGPYRGSNLTDAYREAMNSNSLDHVSVTDFGNYQPSEEPAAWMVSPIGPASDIRGVLALQLPISKLNRVMTFNGNWGAAGLGRTGETLIVGPDELMRSNSRLFIEDPAAYRGVAVKAGTPAEVADQAVRQHGTTLVQPVATESASLALQGQHGTLIGKDYEGHETLQAYAPVNLPGLNWTIVAKLDTSEAFAPVATFTRTLVLSTAVIIFIVCIAALLLARLFVRPVRQLEAGARRISAGDYDVTLPVVSRDEFSDLTHAFNEMSRNLRIKEDLLTEQRQENDRLLLSLMPEQVVRRYREGEETIAQDHQDVTVIFADIVGLDALANNLSSDESVSMVNRLVRQFDAAAVNLGVEKIRTLHNGYLASCGLNVPRLDNVRRTVDFAIEMQHIIDRFNGESGNHLQLRAGINTGTVTSGLVGRTSLAYDMWGAAVNLAYQVQSGFSQPGVYVTAKVHETMRDSRQFTAAGEITVDGRNEPVWQLSERQ